MTSTITCPNCSHEIEITEVMSAQLEKRIRSELESAIIEEARAKAAEEVAIELEDREAQLEEARASLKSAEQEKLVWRKKERELAEREASLTQDREQLEEQARQKLASERQQLIDAGRKKAAEQFAAELKDREDQISEYERKMESARAAELELRKRERELKNKTEELELTVTRTLDAERDKIRLEARKTAAEEHGLKSAEKDKKITDLLKQMDEMKRKAEQGSQQAQGEILELALEDLLRRTFPSDVVEDVPKGIKGGDVLQRVISSAGIDCGTILWETKRTKNWSDGWLAKLRQDQRDAKAAVAILVSTVLPDGVEHFATREGIWVCSWECAVHLAAALRSGLLEVAKARRAIEGQHGKMEVVYNYLASPEFRNRVAGIVEPFVAMKDDLEKERRTIQRQWAMGQAPHRA